MENEEKVHEKVGARHLYEISYLVNAAKSLEEAEALIETFKNSILGKGGVISYEGKPKLIELAYPMSIMVRNKKHVHTSAYFGWIICEVERETAPGIADEFRAAGDIIRFLMIKTKKAPEIRRRTIQRPAQIKKEVGDGVSSPSLDEEKLDKELQEMLTV